MLTQQYLSPDADGGAGGQPAGGTTPEVQNSESVAGTGQSAVIQSPVQSVQGDQRLPETMYDREYPVETAAGQKWKPVSQIAKENRSLLQDSYQRQELAKQMQARIQYLESLVVQPQPQQQQQQQYDPQLDPNAQYDPMIAELAAVKQELDGLKQFRTELTQAQANAQVQAQSQQFDAITTNLIETQHPEVAALIKGNDLRTRQVKFAVVAKTQELLRADPYTYQNNIQAALEDATRLVASDWKQMATPTGAATLNALKANQMAGVAGPGGAAPLPNQPPGPGTDVGRSQRGAYYASLLKAMDQT
jgi:hypothetical protein